MKSYGTVLTISKCEQGPGHGKRMLEHPEMEVAMAQETATREQMDESW